MTRRDITIRLARKSDAEAIASLADELGYRTTALEMGERIDELLARPTCFVAVAETVAGIAGLVAAEERLLLTTGRRVEITALVVAADSRRLGAGRALVAAVEQWQRARGIPMVVVRSNVARQASHPFYEGLGYVRQKTQHGYIKHGDG